MSELYRLIFRGEVLPGQHPAVVRKRLAQAAGFDDAVLDRLFSGRPVVLKREADRATAARFQALFKNAGARLRVLPAEASAVQDAAEARAAPTEPPSAAPPAGGGLELLPPGTAVLHENERAPWRPRQIDTSHLRLEGAQFFVPETPSPTPAPDVTHLTLADLGENLGPEHLAPEPVQAPDLPLAAPGERLAPAPAPPRPAVDLDAVAFDVAEVGADLGTRQRPPPPPAPDVSHLSLVDGD